MNQLDTYSVLLVCILHIHHDVAARHEEGQAELLLNVTACTSIQCRITKFISIRYAFSTSQYEEPDQSFFPSELGVGHSLLG
jgi:hypothetical protein